MKKLVPILLAALMGCLCLAACVPDDDTVYAFEQTIKTYDGKFVVRLEKTS